MRSSFISFWLILASTEALIAPTLITNINKAHAKEATVASQSYDYIIAGGGLAGCALAERLSQDPNKRVLLLEAGTGDYKNKFIRIPAGILRLFKSKFDWQHETKGEKSCNGRNIFLARGKVLGGSSCTNVLLHHRGTKADYDGWGVEGWKGEDVLPYFKNVQDDTTGRDPKFHGTGGEWTMSEVRYQNPLSKKFLEVAGADLGVNDDFNNWDHPQTGAGRFQVSEKNGSRESGATAFLEKAIKRKNVTVRTSAMIRQIDFASTSAVGVTYNIVGDDTNANFSPSLAANGEVILTAGAIASPQILMASGIGPKDHLEDLSIPVISDLPGVGSNLQDHPAAVVSFETPKKGVSVTSKLRISGTKLNNPLPILKWFARGKGELTSVGCDHGAFVNTEGNEGGQPDLQVRFLPARALGPDGMTTFTQFRNTANHKDGYSFQSVATRAKSMGRVRLASSNTHVKPIIDGGYLSSEEDVKTLREGIKLGRKLGTKFGEYVGQEVYPGPEVKSDEEIDEYVRNSVHTANALVGTCKMGDDAMSVVSSDLKVKGVTGVRVADSSIFPTIPGGQTGTPTVMVAVRAAEMIATGEGAGQGSVKEDLKGKGKVMVGV